jgi:hypothetical protein
MNTRYESARASTNHPASLATITVIAYSPGADMPQGYVRGGGG